MKFTSHLGLIFVLVMVTSYSASIEANPRHQLEIVLNLYYNYDGKDAASRNCDHHPDNPKCDYLFTICVGHNCRHLKREVGPIFNAEIISRPDIRLRINIDGILPLKRENKELESNNNYIIDANSYIYICISSKRNSQKYGNTGCKQSRDAISNRKVLTFANGLVAKAYMPIKITVRDFDTLQHDDIDVLHGYIPLTGNIGPIPDRLFGKKSIFYIRTKVTCAKGYSGPRCIKGITSQQQTLYYFGPEYAHDVNQLRVKLVRYLNPGSRDSGDNACDYWPLDSRCDYIFSLCIGNDNDQCGYSRSTHKTFIDANEEFYPYLTIPVRFTETIPKYVNLHMEVYDDEAIQRDVLVDIFDQKVEIRKTLNPYNIVIQGLHTTAEFEVTAICKYDKKCFSAH
ncbi:hypothetical protein TrispH2_004930 [Trichoplax sp. H2]|uniref:Uncharacterized protein n=1 Tax=Trichoplax adhaerens TaxID=10228 RepID=B3RUP8_TRIAD|nr:predicted protein [Trichoplax adhaerens]EDV25858.1 predicted protein [Trichoplax adhaerens]RDD42911.1 hypothetical protein TrispH2_004930 [Trichoplax sp. H2]|eukprot:XP_002111891.1 predicted protein [Trichoplax adhaerens]